jgi:prevent-host-death family protein
MSVSWGIRMLQCVLLHKPMNTLPKPPTITASSLQREVGSVLRRVANNGEHLTIERDGFPIAVIVPLNDYKRLTEGK